jgi:hypothetical protein
MRPTDFCHPDDCVHPHLARSRLALATFAACAPHGVLGSVRHYRGTGRFTTSETASADRRSTQNLELYCLTAWRHERGRLLPTALTAIEPLTPLSQPPVHPRASRAFARAACSPPVPLLEGFERVGGCGDRRDHRRRRLVKADAS